MARTVDNLGVDVSTRYAADQKIYDASQAREAASIPLKIEIDVTVPVYPSEWEKLFETDIRNNFWANFYPPFGYNEQKKRLFTHRLIPSFGLEDKQEAQTKRIDAIMEQLERERKKFEYAWEEEREKEEEKREKEILLKLLKSIAQLNKDLVEINARRGQYQKG